jgi:hypothetical protein
VPQLELVRRERDVLAALRRWPLHLVVAGALAASSLTALALAVVTDQTPHRVWGLIAAAGYLVGSATALGTRRPLAALRVAATGSVLIPLVVLVVTRLAQPEVGVVERSAGLLVATGSPYLAHPVGTYDVNPYLPLMAFFGLPHRLLVAGGLGDPRWWFLLVFGVTFVAADRLVRRQPGTEAILWGVLVFPMAALHASVGGHDLPVVGLACLAIALAGRGRLVSSGLAIGLACSLKASAWPALAVVGMLVVARHGWQPARRFAATAATVVAGTTLPVLLGHGGRALIAQAVAFPLGLGALTSPAAAPAPGVLLAGGGAVARAVGYALLAAVIVACAAWLVLRPPRTAAGAAAFLAAAMLAAALVMPTSRGGYLIYPAVLGALAVRAGALDALPAAVAAAGRAVTLVRGAARRATRGVAGRVAGWRTRRSRGRGRARAAGTGLPPWSRAERE